LFACCVKTFFACLGELDAVGGSGSGRARTGGPLRRLYSPRHASRATSVARSAVPPRPPTGPCTPRYSLGAYLPACLPAARTSALGRCSLRPAMHRLVAQIGLHCAKGARGNGARGCDNDIDPNGQSRRQRHAPPLCLCLCHQSNSPSLASSSLALAEAT
jgi:hypothetical protein